ncbi:MAG: aspartyl/asparaginyl beta-hydroxylase domain-containing protein [Gammaproteobacteria bacterium]|nr:aspartyl/asparaginyl beta-hydroxylase domain-containing protein [Gammaproteobacteria bacterium]
MEEKTVRNQRVGIDDTMTQSRAALMATVRAPASRCRPISGSRRIRRGTKFLAYLLRRAVFWFGFYVRPPVHWFLARFSEVGNPPVFERSVFDWVERLEDQWEALRDEALAVLERPADLPPLREVSPDHVRIATDEKWKVFFLIGYGYEVKANTARCPVTGAAVKSVPGLISAFFSVHGPGTHLPSHYGPTNGMITCHLGLIVPRDGQACRIAIDGKDYCWEEGKCLIFDDTYNHEVWNDTNENRVVLLMHVERPMRQPGKAVADGLLWLVTKSPFVQATRKALDDWAMRG